MNMLPDKWASTPVQGHNQHIPGTTFYLRSRTFQSYFNMIIRCYYDSYRGYKDYGGRGIQVCRRWRFSFQSFIQDMGHRPIGQTLDRINPNKGYYPANCRWATINEQANNKRKKAA